jgi:hypothetical protein
MLRQALATLGLEDPGSQVSGMMITVPVLSRALVNLIQGVYERLELDSSRAFVQDYKESFYYQHPLPEKGTLVQKCGLFPVSRQGCELLFAFVQPHDQTGYGNRGKAA